MGKTIRGKFSPKRPKPRVNCLPFNGGRVDTRSTGDKEGSVGNVFPVTGNVFHNVAVLSAKGRVGGSAQTSRDGRTRRTGFSTETSGGFATGCDDGRRVRLYGRVGQETRADTTSPGSTRFRWSKNCRHTFYDGEFFVVKSARSSPRSRGHATAAVMRYPFVCVTARDF